MTLYIGLVSGTSMDGVEAVLLNIAHTGWEIQGALHLDYPPEISARLKNAVAHPAHCDVDEYGALDAEVGAVFGAAAVALLQQSGTVARAVRAIGSHGQTLLHLSLIHISEPTRH